MTEQKQKIYENILTVKELRDTLSKLVEDGYGNAPVFSKDPEHPRTFNAVYGWGTVYFHEHNYKKFYLILGIDEVEQNGGDKEMKKETNSEEKFLINWITDEEIHFTNNKKITFDHLRCCCEYNYADFKQVEEIALEYEFTEPLKFEIVENYGFRFGNDGKMVSVPCYSVQNGYYDDTVDIYYDGKCVLLNCDTETKIY